ncbi:MAG: hypothetical protein ACREC0_01365 [Methylocella sp.]
MREGYSTSAGLAPIPIGKNTFASPNEFVALKKGKLKHGTNGQSAKDLAKIGPVERRALRFTKYLQSIVLNFRECQHARCGFACKS